MAYLALQKPRKRIHPAYDGNQLANHHIYRMPLEHMGAFVCKYLIYLFIRMAFRMYEYHLEERKGAGGFIQSVNLDTVNNGPLTAVSQQQDAGQLHKEADE